MIKSMTGYGRGTAGSAAKRVVVQVRALNSRFLDTKIRGLDQNPELEFKIRERINTSLIRGSVQIQIEGLNNKHNSEPLKFNKNRFEAIEAVLMSIQKEYGRHLELSEIITFNDLFSSTESEPVNSQNIVDALNKALDQVNQMRSKEGEKLHSEFDDRLKIMSENLSDIESVYRDHGDMRLAKYRKKIDELLNGIPVDENRIAQEVAVLSERADITEEIVRCRSHFEQFRSLLELEEPVGKRLTFLLQEMGREINTLGSKSTESTIINVVVDLKNEMEKMREQAQNVL